MKRIILLICLLTSILNLNANHLLGGEVVYRHLGGLKYEVTVKLYRDCRGVPLSSPTFFMIGDRDTTTQRNINLTLTSIRDVTNYCKDVSKPCNPQNQTISSSIPAQEEHTYIGTIDFNKADSSFKKYCTIWIGAGQCCRPSNITAGASSNYYWVYTELNLCKFSKNNSPIFTNVPYNSLCCNQPVFNNLGAIDTLDRDSLSYSWDNPMTGWKTYVNWSSGKSKSSPFSDYWPIGYNKSKGPNPSVNPPIGTYLDPETGDFIFTPTNCSEVTPASIKVTEWRKDSTGNYQKVGEVRRDIIYTIITCPSNSPPTLNGPYKYDVCAGQKLCFNINSDDKPYSPPPPQKAPLPDTVKMIWNGTLLNKGATFTIIDSTARLPRGQFCWQTKVEDASDLPYYFTITVSDDDCPRNAKAIKSYYIKVKKMARTKIVKNHIKNGLYELKSELEKEFKGSPTYFWEIYDSTMKLIDTSLYFINNGGSRSNRQLDSVQFYYGGKYIIHHRINNPPLNCPTDYFDTLKVAPVTPILRISPTSLQENWVCKNTIDTIFPILRNAQNPVKFKWSTSSTDTLPYLIIDNKKDSTYRVDVYDGAGYHKFAIWKFYIIKEPDLTLGKDILACSADSVLLETKALNFTNTVYWKWKFEGKQISTDTKIKVFNPGFYSLEIYDSNQCVSKIDTIKVSKMIVNVDAGVDRKVCAGDTVMLTANGLDTVNGKSGNYYWYINASTKAIDTGNIIIYKFKTDTTMIVKLLQSKGILTCSDIDTVKVSFRSLPQIILGRSSVCQNESEFDLHTIILKPTNSYTGIVSWKLLKTLKKPDGSDNSLTDLVSDKDTSGSDHFYLKVDKQTIDLKTKFIDSVMLGLTYKDEFGCQNFSSNDASISIRSNVDVSFNTNEQKRCFGDSLVYLSNDYGVNYYGGKWFTNNDSSNYLKWPQGNGVQLSEKLGTKTLDTKGGRYLLKYVLENNKCLSSRNAKLSVVPYPAIIWTQTDQSDSVILTDKSTNSDRREWYINSKKMSDSSVFYVSKGDAKTKVILLKVFNFNCESDSIIIPKIVGNTSKLSLTSFIISPNPVRNKILINTNTKQSYKIEVINSLGQLVLKKSMNYTEEVIEVSHLPNGIYSIIFKTPNAILVQKFIKTSD